MKTKVLFLAGLATALLSVMSMASAGTAPTAQKPPNSCPSNPTDPKCIRPLATKPVAESIYECKKGTDGVTRCTKIRPDDGEGDEVNIDNLDKFDLAEVLAVSRVLKTGAPTPILSDSHSGPITQCGNGRGQTACCRIIAGGGDLTYIECGNPQGQKLNSFLEFLNKPATQACGSRPGSGACCRRVYDPNGDDGLGTYDIVCDGHG